MSEIYKIVKGRGAGGFLNPPGDPAHTYTIETWSSNRKNARQTGIMAITADHDWIPATIRAQAQKIIAGSTPVESELWVRNVYGYFRSLWTVDGEPWSNSTSLIPRRPGVPDDWHAATVFIRKWFPNHKARTDLIADPGKGYGSWPCDRCGKRVQYEARIDALAVVNSATWTYEAECIDGAAHERA